MWRMKATLGGVLHLGVQEIWLPGQDLLHLSHPVEDRGFAVGGGTDGGAQEVKSDDMDISWEGVHFRRGILFYVQCGFRSPHLPSIIILYAKRKNRL